MFELIAFQLLRRQLVARESICWIEADNNLSARSNTQDGCDTEVKLDIRSERSAENTGG